MNHRCIAAGAFYERWTSWLIHSGSRELLNSNFRRTARPAGETTHSVVSAHYMQPDARSNLLILSERYALVPCARPTRLD